MKFKMPESGLTGINAADLDALLKEAMAEYGELAKIDDDALTDEQLDDLEALGAAINEIGVAQSAIEEADAARKERIAAAKNLLPENTEEEPTETEPEGDEGDGDEPEPEVEPEEEVEPEKEEAVVASGTKQPVVRKAAPRAPKPEVQEPTGHAVATIEAATGLRSFSGGTALDLEGASRALVERMGTYPTTRSRLRQRDAVFTIKKVVDETRVLNGTDNEADFNTLVAAATDSRRFERADEIESGKDALVAAGGWCAPSETVYAIPTLETIDGLVNLPEVTMRRGGINFTKGPDFTTAFAGMEFRQTEAQAEAGTEKVFIEIDCPDFEEVRLDAIGYGITAPILTNKAYPELIQRYLRGAVVAHAHYMNAAKINAVATALGTALNANEIGSFATDALDAMALQATRLRYKHLLGKDAPLEAIAPLWARELFRKDLSNRTGVEMLAVTDAQINAWFSARHIRVQWVYDYQTAAINSATVTWPTTVDVLLFTPGAFVVGTADVITLDSIYDSETIKVNSYIATFTEEGFAVYNPVGGGVKVQISTDGNLYGRTGAADIKKAV
jgi:hypothetical protein